MPCNPAPFSIFSVDCLAHGMHSSLHSCRFNPLNAALLAAPPVPKRISKPCGPRHLSSCHFLSFHSAGPCFKLQPWCAGTAAAPPAASERGCALLPVLQGTLRHSLLSCAHSLIKGVHPCVCLHQLLVRGDGLCSRYYRAVYATLFSPTLTHSTEMCSDEFCVTRACSGSWRLLEILSCDAGLPLLSQGPHDC